MNCTLGPWSVILVVGGLAMQGGVVTWSVWYMRRAVRRRQELTRQIVDRRCSG